MADDPQFDRAISEPIVTMSAVKLDKDGNVVEDIPFNDVQVSPGFIEQIKQAAKEGWAEGKAQTRKDD
jgi:hypothetical protein